MHQFITSFCMECMNGCAGADMIYMRREAGMKLISREIANASNFVSEADAAEFLPV